MRSALLCVFFALIITQRCRAVEEGDFRPTPIPLNDWRHDKRGGRAGTLHDIIKTDAPPTMAAFPAHYWEDALRHSVYLTLVRDKIDQLITKGLIVSPNSKPEQQFSKEVDDHDLWEKIKSAPFDRRGEQPSSTGDVQIMAKGRLLEENGGLRFSEDETSSEQCQDDSCAEGVKAFWSVKRVRQRDDETSPGKYHYELTFSVTSQVPKKKRKPYENPIRTFTVKETEPPRDNWANEPVSHSPRSQRAIWFHKNINVPQKHYPTHSHNQNLDRIFSSLFTDDDLFDNPPPRYKVNTYPTHIFPSHPKAGFVSPQSEFIHQKKLLPYPYKPHTYKFSRPLPSPPLQHVQHPKSHLLEIELPFNHHPPTTHTFSYTDQGFMSSNTVKTTRPAFLPTPVTIPFTKNHSINTEDKYLNLTETTFRDADPVIEPDANFEVHYKPRPTAVKLNYFAEHVRPPVFNTPPGVFVTMDKKPFKPMPPLKLLNSPKLGKSKPIDFRPSLQVLEAQFSDHVPIPDTEFRPIAMGYVENGTKSKDKNDSDKPVNKIQPITNNDQKPKKLKSLTTATYEPDIITASDESSDNTEFMEYTSIIGAITRTTPMASQKEKTYYTENATFISTTLMPSTSTLISSTTEATSITTKLVPVPSTSSKPKKRTRPPPKFKGPEKFKKNKRVSSTTPKTTTTIEVSSITKLDSDLSPQASSASFSGSKNFKTYKQNAISTTPINKEPVSTTTTFKPTTTTTTESITPSTVHTTTTEKEPPVATTQPKSKNRFRQSTLMHKGTSVKHDRWSSTSSEKNRTVLLSKQFPPRRKGSNFQGYISTTPKKEDKQRIEEDHLDHSLVITTVVSSTTEVENNVASVSSATGPTYDETMDQYDFSSETTSDFVHTNENDKDVSDNGSDMNNVQETKDQTEYIFTTNTSPSERIIDPDEEITTSTTDKLVPSSSPSSVKKKLKCKKKKNQNKNSTEEANTQSSGLSDISIATVLPTTTPTTTENAVTPNIIDELLGAFTFDEPSETAKDVSTTTKPEYDAAASENVESYLHFDENVENLLGSFHNKENDNVDESEEYDDDIRDHLDEEASSFFREDDSRPARDASDYTDYQERPYSLLELMAME